MAANSVLYAIKGHDGRWFNLEPDTAEQEPWKADLDSDCVTGYEIYDTPPECSDSTIVRFIPVSEVEQILQNITNSWIQRIEAYQARCRKKEIHNRLIAESSGNAETRKLAHIEKFRQEALREGATGALREVFVDEGWVPENWRALRRADHQEAS